MRILRPREYELIKESAGELDNTTRLDALLLTGLRYVEAQRLQENPRWFDGNFIHLPPGEAVRKVKRTQVERWVRLNPLGKNMMPYFFKAKPLPTYAAWSQNLERWAEKAGLDTAGLSPKTTRKTWESWLVASYPEHVIDVFLSQGHTIKTSLQHYLNMPFTDEDKAQMRKWVQGWV